MTIDRTLAGSVAPCCYQRAATRDAAFCGECRSPLLRCMAHEECGGLLGPDGVCPVCVAPELYLDSGARMDVKAGGALVLPIVIRNSSPVRRPLFVTNIWVRQGDGELKKQDLGWERLDAGATKPVFVQTAALERQGRQLIEISFSVSTRYRWREESFAFRASLEVDIKQGGSIVINQTIHAGGAEGGLGGAVNAPIRIEADPASTKAAASAAEPTRLSVVRADGFERQIGLRGYSTGVNKGAVISRNAVVTFNGFSKDDAPPPRPVTTPDSALSVGRFPPKGLGGLVDVHVEAIDAHGKTDEALSRAISRRHFDFFLQNGRLRVHAIGEAGLVVGEARIQRDAFMDVDDGDVIRILPRYPDALALKVRMRANFGEIESITITRDPAIQESIQ